MAVRSVNAGVRAALEYGPVIGFVVAYMIYKDEVFVFAGTEYTGFVAVTALFIPVFLLSVAALWALTGRVSRMQVVTSVMLTVFGGLSVWLNDPRLFKMKPTAVYLLLGSVLGLGLLMGKSWLKYVMEDMIPLREKGWKRLTRRVTAMFFVSALANEVVWRTQSEEVWVLFETLAMPVIIFLFFMAQTPLFVKYATLNTEQK